MAFGNHGITAQHNAAMLKSVMYRFGLRFGYGQDA